MKAFFTPGSSKQYRISSRAYLPSESTTMKPKDHQASPSKHHYNTRKGSLRVLPQSVLGKLSSSTSTVDNLDSDVIASEIHRRLTCRVRGKRRMSILSQSGSYKFGSEMSEKKKGNSPIEQLSLSRKRKLFEDFEPRSSSSTTGEIRLQSSTDGDRSEGSSTSGVIQQTRDSNNAFTTKRNLRNSVLGKSKQFLAATEGQSTIPTEPKETRKKVPRNLNLNGTIRKMFGTDFASKQMKSNNNNGVSQMDNYIDSDELDEDGKPRRMSFDEYQLLQHKKKLEKDLIFKTYREKRAEFIQNETKIKE